MTSLSFLFFFFFFFFWSAAPLQRPDARDDTVFCASTVCNQTQLESGYHVFSAEGLTPANADESEPTIPLYFWWNPQTQDNWVTNSSVSPGPGYDTAHGVDGFLFANSKTGRLAAVSFYCPQTQHHILTASAQGKAFAQSKGCQALYTLGYVDPPGRAQVWHERWKKKGEKEGGLCRLQLMV